MYPFVFSHQRGHLYLVLCFAQGVSGAHGENRMDAAKIRLNQLWVLNGGHAKLLHWAISGGVPRQGRSEASQTCINSWPELVEFSSGRRAFHLR